MKSGEWGVGSGEWGVGSGECRSSSARPEFQFPAPLLPTPYSLLLTPHSLPPMPAEEFDAYLRALSSLLRLEPAQRAELADEFRDHLETRLEELTAAGVPRARAVETALEEFGDAAGLASHFTSQHRFRVRRRRRKALGKFVMKTLPAAAALAVLGAVAWLAAPPNPVLAPPAPAVAQDVGPVLQTTRPGRPGPARRRPARGGHPGGDRRPAGVRRRPRPPRGAGRGARRAGRGGAAGADLARGRPPRRHAANRAGRTGGDSPHRHPAGRAGAGIGRARAGRHRFGNPAEH